MASKYNIDITARDRTGEAIKHVNDSFDKLAKGTPLESVSRHFSAITEKGRAFGGLARGITSLGDSSRVASGGLGEAAGEAGDLGGALGLVGGVAGVASVGLLAAATAATKFELADSAAGASVGRFADVLGISAQKLQIYQLAGEKFGVTAENMGSAIHGVSTALEDAAAGRNQAALMLWSRLGLGAMPRLANGAIDATKAMDMLADAMQDQSPQARELIANTFGMGAALDFLIQKANVREQAERQAAASGAVRSQKQIDDDIRMQRSAVELGETWKRLLNVLSTKLIIPWLKPSLEGLTSFLGVGQTGTGGHVDASLSDILHGRATIDEKGNVVESEKGYAETHRAQVDTSGVPQPGPRAAPGTGGRTSAGGSLVSRALFGQLETQFALPAGLLDRIWNQESRRGSHMGPSSAGALGHFQFEPKTAAQYGVKDPFNLQDSAEGAARYFADLMRHYGGDAAKAIAAYNWGQGHLDRDIARNGADWANHLPRETLDYLARVGGGGASGKVDVDIHLRGAPAGTVVATRTSGPRVAAGVKVSPSLAGASV